MKLAPFATVACALALLVSSPTLASIPGNLEEKAKEGLLHVCRDVEPGNPIYIVCDEQVDPGNPQSDYTASECVAAGLEPVCVIDFIPRVRVPGRLALFNDEAPSGTFGAQAGLSIDLTFGLKKIGFVELFVDTIIGNWNAFSEFELLHVLFSYTNFDQDAFQFANNNLEELGFAIRDAAQAYFDNVDFSNTVAVLTDVVFDWNKTPVDGFASDLGSANYYRVQVRFARVRP